MMVLRFIGEIKRDRSAPTTDQRRRLNRVVAEYVGDGERYRKSFESYSEPQIPESGTHAELNALRKQW